MDSIPVESLIEGLCLPEAYPFAVSKVDLVQTHISLIFLTEDFVYKVKKPVNFGFLDFSSLDLRRRNCQEELRLNRRLAKGIYLEVVAIAQDSSGRLLMEGPGPAAEWAVKMKRLPERWMLDRLLLAGEVDNRLIHDLASLLVAFHGQALGGQEVDEYGSPRVIRSNVQENFDLLESILGDSGQQSGCSKRVASPLALSYLRRRVEAFLVDRLDLFERRVQDGCIREGHGDLHAGNLCAAPDGLVAYDCIEFSQRFRCGDVASDLAFLVMDLDARGYPGFAGYLAKRYAMQAEDRELMELLPFYKGYRAMVRAKVACLASRDPDRGGADQRSSRLEAMRYFQLACAYEMPPLLLLMCGLPASGKSWLAKRLVVPLRAVLLRSDVRRKSQAGRSVAGSGRGEYGEGLYSSERRQGTYVSILEDAGIRLAEGRSVIVDATFSNREQRAAFVERAKELSVTCLLVHVHASDEESKQRLKGRLLDPEEASDAGLEVYIRAREVFEPPEELAPESVVDVTSPVDSTEELGAVLIDRAIRLGMTTYQP